MNEAIFVRMLKIRQAQSVLQDHGIGRPYNRYHYRESGVRSVRALQTNSLDTDLQKMVRLAVMDEIEVIRVDYLLGICKDGHYR